MGKYEKSLFAQMRTVVISNEVVELTDENLVKAMTINEELKAMGFCLKPSDVIVLAKSVSLEGFLDKFRELQDEVKSAPMYPGFPKQVMEISEAEFRWHQLMHYFSTYGQELFFGERISEGWRPYPKDAIKSQPDVQLLSAKVLQVITEEDMYTVPLQKILTKRERMTIPEMEIVTEAVTHVSTDFISGITVPFKENLINVFCHIADTLPRKKALPVLRGLCQHTGDVWKCYSRFLSTHKHSLSTAQRKLIVRLMESYPIEDFESNLYTSRVGASHIIRKLNFLSYNRFSRSEEHKEAVRKLRNGELKSWNSYVEAKVLRGDIAALDMLAKRPGILVRSAARLIRLGFPAEKICEKLCENAETLSMQTLVSLLNFFVKSKIRESREEADAVYDIMHKALAAKMRTVSVPFASKKIFFEEGDYDFDNSVVELNNKSEEGGYVRSGMAFKLPDSFSRVRFFVYWNDEHNRSIDLDLHGLAVDEDGSVTHVDWSHDFRKNGLLHSGDITESDSTEFVDIDLSETDAECVAFTIHSYGHSPVFSDIETCFVGLTAVGSIGEEVQLYDPKNCFVSHDLKSACKTIRYGEINVKDRFLRIIAKPNACAHVEDSVEVLDDIFSMREYLEMFAEAQGATVVSRREDADMVLVAGKPADETEISIFDSNFFCD